MAGDDWIAVALFAYRRKIRIEEATLNAAFGADYEAYRQPTGALLPGVF
jgi:protein-S-isoprenylcysteine O-methyltransferase Ste14